MFCENCGKPIPGGSKFCSNCGSPVAAQQPVQEPQFQPPVQEPQFQPPVQQVQYQYQQPAQQYQQPVQQYQQPNFEVSRPANGKYSRKKKGGKAGLIVAAVVLVALVACVVLFWNAISGFALRNFGDPTEYMVYVEKNNADTAIEALCEVYGEVLDYSDEQPDASVAMALRPGEAIIALLETALNQEGMPLDLDWVKEIDLDMQTLIQGDKGAVDMTVGLNGSSIATLRVILDYANNAGYLSVPQLNETWLKAPIDGEDPTESMHIYEPILAAMPSEEVLEELLERYTEVVLANLGEAEKRTETVKVEGVEQKLMVLRVELTQQEILQLANDVLKQACEDEQLLQIMDELSATMSVLQEIGEPMDMRQAFQQEIELALEDLQQVRAEATDEVVIVLETYVDDSHRIVGRDLSFPSDGVQVSYVMAVKGTQFGFEAIGAGAVARGSGNLGKNGTEGSFGIYVDGMKLMTVEVSGMNVRDDALTGTLTLRLDSELLTEAGLDSSVTSLLGGALSIRITLEEKAVDLSLLAGASELVGLKLTEKENSLTTITVPDGIDVDDYAALEQWLKDVQLDTLVRNLEAAGMPAELVELVNTLAQLLAFL